MKVTSARPYARSVARVREAVGERVRRAKMRWLLRCYTAEWRRVTEIEKDKRAFEVHAAGVVETGRCRRRLAAWRGVARRKALLAAIIRMNNVQRRRATLSYAFTHWAGFAAAAGRERRRVCGARARLGLMDSARHVILHTSMPRFINQMPSYDVASSIYQAIG
jgi:hypothetical protein